MTREEIKANELIEKYYKLFSVDLENTISEYEAIHCALTFVEDIIIETSHYQDLVSIYQDDLSELTVIERLIFWQEIKIILTDKLK